jgi:hypothetical protein
VKSPLKAPRRPTGSVASLPKTVREQISQLLLDGLSYPAIARQMTARGHKLNEQNIGRWSRGGHRDWLRDQERLDTMARTRHFAIKAVQTHGGETLHEASLSLAASQVYELLTHFDIATLREKMDNDPAQFTSLVNTLARLADQGLKYERYRAEVAERKANIQKLLVKAGLQADTRRMIEDEMNLM